MSPTTTPKRSTPAASAWYVHRHRHRPRLHDAAEVLRDRPDFFLSEEVTCTMPSGTELHLGVYGITERDHIEIQKRRNDFIALLMYLTNVKSSLA